MFSGEYVTGDIDEAYLQRLNDVRSDGAKTDKEKEEIANLEIHNEG